MSATTEYFPTRVRWKVVPRPGLFRWAVVRRDEVQRLFLFKARAVEAARAACEFELEVHGYCSELTIMTRDGRTEDKRPYGADSRHTAG